MFTLDKRPQVLAEVIGNKSTIQEIKNRSVDINFSPYNIFYGPTGTGKSTVVFIMAKLLNCKSPVKNEEGYYDPCNKCEACIDVIEGGYNRDIHYLDASKMGKEEVNKLGQLISRYSMFDKNKIVIIDEAHLLASKEAKAAMLLITEKIRKNAYLFMCTTQPKKIPKDLMSRFEQYRFKKPPIQEIVAHLLDFLNKNEDVMEKIPDGSGFDEEALTSIAYNSNGSVRQALRILERCIYSGSFSKEQIRSELGFLDEAVQKDALFALLQCDNSFFRYFYEAKEENNLEDLFTYMLFLTNKALIYKLTKDSGVEVIQEWENNYYNLEWIIKQGTLQPLHDILLKIEDKRNGFYFSSSYFLSLIVSYINKYNVPKLHRLKEEEKPKRRKPVN